MIAGIVNMAHDASLALIDDDGNIDFASASERYCKIKHHTHLSTHNLIRTKCINV